MDVRKLNSLPVEGVEDNTTGQTNDGTTDVTGTGQRYGDPSVARTADFDADKPKIISKVDSAEILGAGTEPAITAHAPGQKRSEAYGKQRP